MGMHDDHRQRLKERYRNEGLDGFAEHTALELLLFYAIPRKDTNELAHRLIQTFGSLAGVLQAPRKELEKVEGIGENAALLLSMVLSIDRLAQLNRAKNIKTVASPFDAAQILVPLFYGETVESVRVISLDNRGRVIHCDRLAKGTVNRATLQNRVIVEAILRHNAAGIVLSHNHPYGKAKASLDDIEMTSNLKQILRLLNVQFVDHIIVAGHSWYSMAEELGLKDTFNFNGKTYQLVCTSEPLSAE